MKLIAGVILAAMAVGGFCAVSARSGEFDKLSVVGLDAIDVSLALEVGDYRQIGFVRNGGTAYFWDVAGRIPSIVAVEDMGSRSLKPDDKIGVGFQELDVFKLTAVNAGAGKIKFDLTTSFGSTARTVFVEISVK